MNNIDEFQIIARNNGSVMDIDFLEPKNIINVDFYAKGEGLLSTKIEYQVTQNSSFDPEGTWSETFPQLNQGEYLWVKNTYNYTDGTIKIGYSGGYIGKDFKLNGQTITSVAADNYNKGIVVNVDNGTLVIGYTNADNNFVTRSDLATVASSGDYNDLLYLPDLTVYATNTALNNTENNLQDQIDAITAASDVVDIVGTYTDLQNYDTTYLTDKDIIKVLEDSTHSNATTYYQWIITSGIGSWSYIGSEGPYYTKSEINTTLNDYVKFTDYATNSIGGVIKTTSTYGHAINSSGYLYGSIKSYADYPSYSDNGFISKGTLENVITGKGLISSSNFAIVEGANNGEIKYTEDGTNYTAVSIHGLGSAAYTASTAYDTAGAASTAETNAKNYADGLLVWETYVPPTPSI